MFRQSLVITAGWLIATACLHGQTTNDCWAVRFGSTERRPYDSGTFGQRTDETGNAYVMRYISSQNPSFGFICAKFALDGNKRWERTYSATNGQNVYAADFTPGTNGSMLVLAVASTNFGAENVEVRVLHFDSEGSLATLSHFRSKGFHHRFVVTATGNIYVTGVNLGAAVNGISIAVKDSPIPLTKLDANGDGLWCTHTNGAWSGAIMPFSLAIGSQGDLYAAWSTWSADYFREFITARLSSDGLERWRSTYTYMNLQEPYSLLVDDQGNVFTTGSIFYGAPYDTHFTVKYSADGVQLWGVTWPEQSEATQTGAAALDDFGNLYITLGIPWQDRALVTAKFDRDGNPLWTIYENAETEDRYWNVSVTIDRNQCVCVSGLHYSPNDSSWVRLSYLQNTTPDLPVIRRQPTGGRVRADSSVSLEVLATGLQPLAYQWRLDGNDIPGETNGVLVLSNIGTNQSGTYAVLITNAAGCALSTDANVTAVEIPPFRFGPPRLTQTIFQHGDGSWATNHFVEMLLTGGRPGWYYTMESSSNLVHWQSSVSRGVDADGSALFLFWRQGQSSMFFRASTQP